MNLQTMENRTLQTAAKQALSLILYSARMAGSGHKSTITRENSPRIAACFSLMGKLFNASLTPTFGSERP